MIKLKITGEEPPEPEKTVEFQFRRHDLAGRSSKDAEKAFLIGSDSQRKRYPLAIDGLTKTVEVRRAEFEELGFTVKII